MSQPETILRGQIRDALLAAGYAVMTNNLDQRNGRKGGLGTGSADLIVVVPVPCIVKTGVGSSRTARIGRTCALEVKLPVNPAKHTDEQKAWGADLNARGGYYAVVHSVEEAIAAVQRAARGEVAG